MTKLFMISAMCVGLLSLQACNKEEKKVEEEKAPATLFTAPYGGEKRVEGMGYKSQESDMEMRKDAFFGN